MDKGTRCCCALPPEESSSLSSSITSSNQSRFASSPLARVMYAWPGEKPFRPSDAIDAAYARQRKQQREHEIQRAEFMQQYQEARAEASSAQGDVGLGEQQQQRGLGLSGSVSPERGSAGADKSESVESPHAPASVRGGSAREEQGLEGMGERGDRSRPRSVSRHGSESSRPDDEAQGQPTSERPVLCRSADSGDQPRVPDAESGLQARESREEEVSFRREAAEREAAERERR